MDTVNSRNGSVWTGEMTVPVSESSALTSSHQSATPVVSMPASDGRCAAATVVASVVVPVRATAVNAGTTVCSGALTSATVIVGGADTPSGALAQEGGTGNNDSDVTAMYDDLSAVMVARVLECEDVVAECLRMEEEDEVMGPE
jgi:hypothetical protein